RLEVFLRRADTRILLDLERRLERFARDLEAYSVRTRRHLWTRELRLEGVPGPTLALDLRGVRVTHVPEEAVEAGKHRHLRILRRRRLGRSLGRRLLRRLRLLQLLFDRLRIALEFADHLAARVEERERRLGLRLVAEPVLDEHAARRIRAGVDVDRDLLAGRLLALAIRDHRRARHAVVLPDLRWLREAHVGAVANGDLRAEQVRLRTRDLRSVLPQRLQVVEDPERATVRAEHEVVVLDHEVVDGNDRQVAAKSLPAAAVVERDVRAGLGAGVQQPLLGG